MTPRLSLGITLRKVFAVSTIVPLVALSGWAVAAYAATASCTNASYLAAHVSDCQKQAAAAEVAAQQAAAQAAQQQTLAQRAAASLLQVNGQIVNLNSAMQSTQQQITSIQAQIAQKDQDVAGLESDLRTISDQQNALIRQLYIMAESHPDDLALFSDESISARAQQQTQFTALENAATASYNKTQAAKAQVVAARDSLQQQSNVLSSLQTQQQGQQQVLADTQSTQQALKTNALVAQQQLETQEAAEQKQAAAITQEISALTAQSNWGNQIVSSDDASWYYMQTGDNTRLGNSWYTVGEVGCLITSLAMVATYYGHSVTPDYLARYGSFTSQGYLVGLPNIGINRQPETKVNWSTVYNEVTNGRPVIVSIYLPSVGVVNSDGSSHFIVIKGYANGQYLMQDPIGPGRGYNMNQVRSMILITPQ